MLYEFSNKQTWTMGFNKEGSVKHKRLFSKLKLANDWFVGKNGLHARNCSGSHLQSFSVTQHMFQQFGYGGEREWKKLTIGVAACLGMMKLQEDNKHNQWWRELRQRVREFKGLPVPAAIESLFLDLKIDENTTRLQDGDRSEQQAEDTSGQECRSRPLCL